MIYGFDGQKVISVYQANDSIHRAAVNGFHFVSDAARRSGGMLGYFAFEALHGGTAFSDSSSR